jgi:hypothetical protein
VDDWEEIRSRYPVFARWLRDWIESVQPEAALPEPTPRPEPMPAAEPMLPQATPPAVAILPPAIEPAPIQPSAPARPKRPDPAAAVPEIAGEEVA